MFWERGEIALVFVWCKFGMFLTHKQGFLDDVVGILNSKGFKAWDFLDSTSM